MPPALGPVVLASILFDPPLCSIRATPIPRPEPASGVRFRSCLAERRRGKAAEHQHTGGGRPLKQEASIDLFTVHCGSSVCSPMATPVIGEPRSSGLTRSGRAP
jgi:hypothetical protein